MLTFYYAPNSCALASHIALEIAKAPYDAVRLDFAQKEQLSPAYLKVNPKGRVPSLATERGVITETPAILQYIAQVFPEARLAPLDDPFAMATMNEFHAYLCATVHVAHAHKFRGSRWADDERAIAEMKKKVAANMTQCFALIEQSLLRGPWVLGEQFSVSDAYLFTLSGWLKGDGVEIDQFPNVSKHRAAMAGDARVQRVVQLHDAK